MKSIKHLLPVFFSYLLILFFFIAISCSQSDDAAPASSTDNAATIDGKPFAPTDTKATNAGTGLSISLKDTGKEITLSTSDKVAGTYTITNTVPAGRTQATLSAIVSYFDGTDLYFGSGGSIVITIDASGKASGTFTITLKTATGKTIELKDGKFTSLVVGSLPAGKCLISKVSSDNSTSFFDYNAEGKLIKFLNIESATENELASYFYSNGVMTNIIRMNVDGSKTYTEQEKWNYTSGKVTTIDRSSNRSGVMTKEDNYVIEYNTAGQVSKVTWNRASGTDNYKEVSVLDYDGNGNVTKGTYTYTHSGGGTSSSVYSNYDNKVNLYAILAQSLGASNQIFFAEEQFGYELSKNNPGKEVHTSGSNGTTYTDTSTYTYEYNAKGYPTKANDSSSCTSCDTESLIIEYVGCN